MYFFACTLCQGGQSAGSGCKDWAPALWICSQGLYTHVVWLKDVAAVCVLFFLACHVQKVDFGLLGISLSLSF